MRFYRVSADEPVINLTAARILKHLNKRERVLWLLSGGSAIKLQIEIAKRLTDSKNLANLTVSLVDERFGTGGHSDSNWRQLVDSGFNLHGAKLRPVLTGKDMAATAADFDNFLAGALVDNDYRIAIAGIGPDGHTLGIKPGSPAVDTKNLAIGYDWEDYQRITATAQVIKKLDAVIVYAFGEAKKQQLENLKEDLQVADQPAQALKLCPDVTVFSDQLGESFNNKE
jgi:6-phosphogluconolactonase/glucosamine-6-phosphate isomerase/deaminase